jgi:hypothetical protein
MTQFICTCGKYTSTRKYNIERHLNSIKHPPIIKSKRNDILYICNFCEESYENMTKENHYLTCKKKDLILETIGEMKSEIFNEVTNMVKNLVPKTVNNVNNTQVNNTQVNNTQININNSINFINFSDKYTTKHITRKELLHYISEKEKQQYDEDEKNMDDLPEYIFSLIHYHENAKRQQIFFYINSKEIYTIEDNIFTKIGIDDVNKHINEHIISTCIHLMGLTIEHKPGFYEDRKQGIIEDYTISDEIKEYYDEFIENESNPIKRNEKRKDYNKKVKEFLFGNNNIPLKTLRENTNNYKLPQGLKPKFEEYCEKMEKIEAKEKEEKEEKEKAKKDKSNNIQSNNSQSITN